MATRGANARDSSAGWDVAGSDLVNLSAFLSIHEALFVLYLAFNLHSDCAVHNSFRTQKVGSIDVLYYAGNFQDKTYPAVGLQQILRFF